MDGRSRSIRRDDWKLSLDLLCRRFSGAWVFTGLESQLSVPLGSIVCSLRRRNSLWIGSASITYLRTAFSRAVFLSSIVFLFALAHMPVTFDHCNLGILGFANTQRS